ncbi:UDP-xylose and UDP-N-acetylglucosamine transporter [Vanrija pseudolonga]|uniref:UDP-xylose and UDP-N-acetylglucosamine transporter n=1 Tax=Vanrija pseudolonga TaxID=143232 RepID=A0AAF0YHF3_9TREE|nr:UDP-xylose and UDP-N-acetylglucosamine transporter [Vanrija pseudolonga]
MGTEIASAVAESAASEWAAILSLVFGGCCSASNVWALEAVLKSYPASGTFLTFAQFLYVAVQTFSSQFYFPPGARFPRWRKNEVPIRRWMVQVVLFFGVSLMNNYAFGLKIPVTVHIIFRSGGLCVSMLTGYFIGGKRYSAGQIAAGVIITLGIILATISAPKPPRPTPTPTATTTDVKPDLLPDNVQYALGIGLLSLALFLSAWLGLWQEKTYKMYGNKWREALFYCHFLSLPFFIPMYPTLSKTFNAYRASPPITLLTLPIPSPELALFSPIDDAKRELIRWRELSVPNAFLALAVNVVTQGLCIRGVNRLTSRVSSTTVNLILTLRKAASLAISVWYYGSGASTGLVVGGAMVLGGTMIYSMSSPPSVPKDKAVNGDDKVKGVEAKEEKEANGATISAATSTAVEPAANGTALRQR